MSYASLTGAQAVALFRDLVDDQSVDVDIILSNMNTAQDLLAMERDWSFLEAVDTSLDWLTSDTYLTAHNWPTDCLRPMDIYVSGFDFPFKEIPLKMRERYSGYSYRLYHDYRQRKLYLTGTTSQNRDITFPYIIMPTEIANDAVAIANWPGVAHRMLVYFGVGLWLGGTDADNITKLMRPEHAAIYGALRKRLVMMDAKIRNKARGFQSLAPSRNISAQPDVVDIDA
ncbi:MAG: hypothetical protein [Podoviridae sp. ctviO18]|nr:MAG: hypothetical protein [Podoviridae sp. ctviO18]